MIFELLLGAKIIFKSATKMLGCDFDNIFKKGKQNIVTNALSRKEEDTKSLLCVISIAKSNWVEETREKWKQ